eukprot:TRINITY_DN6454_c0_g1_i1.p1 TRINITY_DN6454_c0_g1~~TRINITY_DN6454_c0_g1_i1.p1  ORF type:complete len:167 (-),score=20.92 TRINITY_DN6454_c0_g1_i1:124-624(-)
MRDTQCNSLTVSSVHSKFRPLHSQSVYFRFLSRQESYRRELVEGFETPRMLEENVMHRQVRLNSLKILSKLIMGKRVFWEWRVRVYRKNVMAKFARLFWRKKSLVKLLRYLYDLSKIKKVNKCLEVKCNAIKLYKKVFNGFKKHLSKRKNIKRLIYSKSQQRFKLN